MLDGGFIRAASVEETMRQRPLVLSALLASVAAGCAPPASTQLEANKEVIRRFTEITNAADWDALDEVMVEDFRRHSQATAGPPVTSREEFRQLQESFLVGMPDQRVDVEMMIAEGDKVAVYATYSGTQTGPMGDFPMTGRRAESKFLAIFRFEDGKIAELWAEWDNLAMLTQLGLFPPPAPAGG
jgi:steroid delta-isomerase-like uncharacterized protein